MEWNNDQLPYTYMYWHYKVYENGMEYNMGDSMLLLSKDKEMKPSMAPRIERPA